MRILALVIDWPLLSPRERANWVTGFLALLALIGMVALAIWLYAIASNPPLGWIATTNLEQVYLPPGVLLKKDFTNVLFKRVVLGGAGGVGQSQIEEWKEDYPSIAEAPGNQNFLAVSEEWNGVLLTYATYSLSGPLHIYVEERGGIKPSVPFGGQYSIITDGENHPRIEGKALVLAWGYSKDTEGIVIVLFTVAVIVAVVLFFIIDPLLEWLFML